MDALRYIGRDIALPGLDVGCELSDLDEQPVIEDRAFLVIPPQADIVGPAHIKGREHLLQADIPARLLRGSQQGLELAESGSGLLALPAGGKEHSEAAGRPSGIREDGIERRG